MDISKACCPDCGGTMQLSRATCLACNVHIDGEFEVSPLARLPEGDQVFVMAFMRHHGSIRKMEEILGISYPTVKNRLRAIVGKLDSTFSVPSPNSVILDQLSRGEITVDEAIERME